MNKYIYIGSSSKRYVNLAISNTHHFYKNKPEETIRELAQTMISKFMKMHICGA